jgi:hypothetical protein
MKQILVLLSALGLTAGAVQAQNLLLNGDFNSPNSGAAPDNWNPWAWGTGWANHQNDATSFDGSYYVAVGATSWNSGGGGVYQTVTGIAAGQSYALSVESGAQAWWKPVGYMTMMWLDGSSTQISQDQLKVVDPASYDVGAPWTYQTLTAVAPSGAAQVKVEFANYNGQGTVWFDNATLTVVPEPSALGLVAGGLGLLLGLRRRGAKQG